MLCAANSKLKTGKEKKNKFMIRTPINQRNKRLESSKRGKNEGYDISHDFDTNTVNIK